MLDTEFRMSIKKKEGFEWLKRFVKMSESDASIQKKKLEELQAAHEMSQRPKSYEDMRNQILRNRGEL